MKRFIIYSILLCFLLTGAVFAIGNNKKEKAPKIQSTEGVEVSNTEVKNISRTQEQDKESKLKAKKRKKIVKNIAKIEKFENKKRIKERDKDFFENRLSKKKLKLEEINEKLGTKNNSEENKDTVSDTQSEVNNEKGEKE